MRKVVLCGMIALLGLNELTFGQTYMIAKRDGAGYELLISKKEFAAIFDSQVAPFISTNNEERYLFEDLVVEDPEPSNIDSRAYLELRASSKRESVVIGITLQKEVMTEQVTRLYITNLLASGSSTPDRATTDAGWKCTSIRMECGGCRKVRENGQVVGCPCFTGEGYCNFETSGGGGSNWPGWLTSFLLALLKFV